MSCAKRTVSVSSRTRKLMPPNCVGNVAPAAEVVTLAKVFP